MTENEAVNPQPPDWEKTVREIYETMSDLADGTFHSGGEVAAWVWRLIKSRHPDQFGDKT